jgi:predicted Zn-ribbon and HTH transcriptional regulator
MTNQQQREYLNHPNRCPYCRSPKIEGKPPTFEGDHILLNIQCSHCDGEWYEVYTLTAIQDPD